MQTKQTFLLALALLVSTIAFSQVGIGTVTLDDSAMLTLESTTQGFLPPRMTDAQRSGITSPVAGLIIFNTTVNCLQWYDGSDWFSPCSSTTSIPVSTSCNTNSTGTMIIGTPVSGVTQTITLDVETLGDYTITTDEVAGVIFSATGSFTSTGSQDLVLTASGTPTASGGFEYNVLNCSFTRSITPLSVNRSLAGFGSNGCNGGSQGSQDLRTTNWFNNGATFSLSAGNYSLTYNVPITASGRVYATSGGLQKRLEGKLLVRIRNTSTGQVYLTSSGNRALAQGCTARNSTGLFQSNTNYSSSAPTQSIPAGTYQIQVYGESYFGGCQSGQNDSWGGCGLSSNGGGSININAQATSNN